MPAKVQVPPDWQAALTPQQASALCGGVIGATKIAEYCEAGLLPALDLGTKSRHVWAIPRRAFLDGLDELSKLEAAARRSPAAVPLHNAKAAS